MLYAGYNRPILNKDQSAKIREQFIASCEMHKDFADYNYQIAKLYFNDGNFSIAHEHVEKALQKNPEYLLAHMLRTKLHIENGEFIQAYHDFTHLRQQYDTYADVMYLNALLLYFNNNYIEALNEIRRALEINTIYHDAYLLELIIYYEVGRLKEMYQIRKQLSMNEINNVPEQYFYNGLLAYERCHWASGIISFESASVLGYDALMCNYNIACLYAFLRKLHKTQDILKKIISKKQEFMSHVQCDSDFAEFRKTDLYSSLEII